MQMYFLDNWTRDVGIGFVRLKFRAIMNSHRQPGEKCKKQMKYLVNARSINRLQKLGVLRSYF
jgi:hypothetical protein